MPQDTPTLTPVTATTPAGRGRVVARYATTITAPSLGGRAALQAVDLLQADPLLITAAAPTFAETPAILQAPLAVNFGTVAKQKTATIRQWNTRPAGAAVIRSDTATISEASLNPATVYLPPTGGASTTLTITAGDRFEIKGQISLSNTLKITARTGTLPKFATRTVATRYSFATQIATALDGTELRTPTLATPRIQLVVEASHPTPAPLIEALKRQGRKPLLVANSSAAAVATISAGQLTATTGYYMVETPGLGEGTRLAIVDNTGTTWPAGASPADGRYRIAPMTAVRIDTIEAVASEAAHTTATLICTPPALKGAPYGL